ncbi:hypothetical protein Tco_1369478 [Tanacetum coccineum]
MPPRRNRPLTEAYEQEFEQRVMARMEERLGQFVDQLADRMNDMMNPRRHRDRNSQGSKGEESENLFFEGGGSSSDEEPDRPRRDQREDNRHWESRIRVNILEFDGNTLNHEGNDIQKTEDLLVSRYIGGLRVQIMDSVNMFDPSKCKKAEKRHLFADEEWEDKGVTDDEYEEPLVLLAMIGPGSCDNLIAKEAVQKLGWKTVNHPKPYKLQWLKKGGEVTISKRVLVAFSVGTTYKDSVWCDVVPMDACHLLLGRPWEYDRNTTHNGRANTYSFLFDGVKITLMPNKPKELVNKPTSTLLTLSQFQDELEMGGDVFMLIGKEVAKDSKIPEAMIPLLEEFYNVFPDELPDGFPPLRDIQHHIDLEPGSQFPNRPHYRRSPREHEDLRRQVKELVSKGHVRESMSPCTVPALQRRMDHGISGATIFTKLDLKSRYSQIRLRPAEFSDNQAVNLSTGFCPFQVVYSAQPRRPLDLMSLPISGSVPKKVQDFVEGLREVHKAVRDNLHFLPYHGDSSDDDLVVNLRENFFYPGGMMQFLDYISWYQRAEIPVKMPPRRNRPLTEAYEQELEQRVMARMEERLDQFVEGEESENPSFKGGGSSSDKEPDRLRREVFEFKEVPKNKRVSLIATKLRGRTPAWWQQLKLTRERVGKPRVTSWRKMKK